MKIAAACLLVLFVSQAPRVVPLREAVVFGGFERNAEAAPDPAAAARWTQIQRRAERSMSRLRPPSSHSGEMYMVWNKRRHYERMFAAVAVPYYATAQSELALAEEAADFVEGMRPCYEWEGFSDCPLREAEFAELWIRHHTRSSFADFLPLFAGHRFLCAAEGFDYEKKAPQASDARKRAIAHLGQAAAGKDPLFKLVASQILNRPACHVRP